MGDNAEVMKTIHRLPDVSYPVLTPNLKGFESAIAAGATEVAIFGAASDSFSMRNINCNVLDSLERFVPVCEAAKAHGVKVRGYVSCVLGCPYEGDVHPDAVAFVAKKLMEMGCYEVSLGDTIGVGTPLATQSMLNAVADHVHLEDVAVHFHNTYGQALANIFAALQVGVSVVDSASAGLGGCPYAKGASGNVPTEDVVYALHGMGIHTGIDLDALIQVGDWICHEIGRENQSKAGVALLAKAAAADQREAVQAQTKAARCDDVRS